MDSEKLPDGTTLYIISGEGPLRPYVFESTCSQELLWFTVDHLIAQVDEAHAQCG
jgi:hypothetical protein